MSRRLHFALLVFLALLRPVAAQEQSADATSFFGVASHFLHTRQIYTNKDDTWMLPRTAPLQQELGTPWVTEQIYALTAKSRALVDDGSANASDKARIADRRKLVDKWLAIYDDAGTKVVLSILATAPKAKNADLINEDFGSWIAELVSRHPSIRAVQLHNEPNLRSFWPNSPEEYVGLYRNIASKIKERNPDVAITVGAISSLSWEPGRKWLRRAIDAGLLDFADGVSVHPYNLKLPPEIDPHTKGPLRESMAGFWEEMQASAPRGKTLKLYLTELGYSSASNGIAGIGSEELQANYLARLMMLYTDFRVRDGIPIEAVFWYDLKNDGSDPTSQEHNFGLVSSDLKRKKPAFDAYQRIIAALPDVAQLRPSANVYTSDRTDTIILSWTTKSGDDLIALWRTGDANDPVSVEVRSRVKPATLKAKSLDVLSGAETKIDLAPEPTGFSFNLPGLAGVRLVTVDMTRSAP